jgi:hypothetical protein
MGTAIQKAFPVLGMKVPYDEEGRASLTAIWIAAGRPQNGTPAMWLRSDKAKEFVAELESKSKVQKRTLLQTVRGGDAGKAGTWGHWQIALAYASWLSPRVHQDVQEGYRQWKEEEKSPGLKLDRAVNALQKKGFADDWIEMRLKGKLATNSRRATMKAHLCDKRESYQAVANIGNLTVVKATASEFRRRNGIDENASTRDAMSKVQLAGLLLYEASVEQKIVDDAAIGDDQCVESAKKVSDVLRPAMRALMP